MQNSVEVWNSPKLRWILHRIQEPFSMHSVIDGQEPQNMFYSSLITHVLQIRKILQKSVPSGDPKVIFCRTLQPRTVLGLIASTIWEASKKGEVSRSIRQPPIFVSRADLPPTPPGQDNGNPAHPLRENDGDFESEVHSA